MSTDFDRRSERSGVTACPSGTLCLYYKEGRYRTGVCQHWSITKIILEVLDGGGCDKLVTSAFIHSSTNLHMHEKSGFVRSETATLQLHSLSYLFISGELDEGSTMALIVDDQCQ